MYTTKIGGRRAGTSGIEEERSAKWRVMKAVAVGVKGSGGSVYGTPTRPYLKSDTAVGSRRRKNIIAVVRRQTAGMKNWGTPAPEVITATLCLERDENMSRRLVVA